MDIDTRWNSTFYMMERFLEHHQLITIAPCLLGKNQMCLNSDQFEEMKITGTALEPFEEATREMLAEKFTSVSKIIPIA